MKNKLLVGISGSFCNHERVLNELEKLNDEYELSFVFTQNVTTLDTRFSTAKDLMEQCQRLTDMPIITSIVEAEKIGPSNIFDLMVIAPCSANTLSRIVHGAYDCPVALCAKAMVRNQKNVLIGIASNDILGISGVNVMKMINMKNFYVLPFYQDAPELKPNSCTSDFTLLKDALGSAFESKQIQPILREKKI